MEALQAAASEAATEHARVTEQLAEAHERLAMVDNNKASDNSVRLPDASNKLAEGGSLDRAANSWEHPCIKALGSTRPRGSSDKGSIEVSPNSANFETPTCPASHQI